MCRIATTFGLSSSTRTLAVIGVDTIVGHADVGSGAFIHRGVRLNKGARKIDMLYLIGIFRKG